MPGQRYNNTTVISLVQSREIPAKLKDLPLPLLIRKGKKALVNVLNMNGITLKATGGGDISSIFI